MNLALAELAGWDHLMKAKYISKKMGPSGEWQYTYPKPTSTKAGKKAEDTPAPQAKKPGGDYTLIPGGLPGGETWKHHFSGHPDGGGQPSPARRKVHDEIVKRALGKPPANPPSKPTLYLMQGGSGAGKSSILRRMGLGDGAVVVNNDDVKVELPEFKKYLDSPDRRVPVSAASDVHVESSYVMKQVREAAIKQRRDIIYDSNLNNIGIARNMIDRFKKLGYNVHLITVHADSNTALNRVRERHVKTGRGVPEWAVRQSLREMPAAFRGIKDLVDSYDLFTTTAQPKLMPDPTTGKMGETTVRHIAAARIDPGTGHRREDVMHPALHARIVGA